MVFRCKKLYGSLVACNEFPVEGDVDLDAAMFPHDAVNSLNNHVLRSFQKLMGIDVFRINDRTRQYAISERIMTSLHIS